MAEWILVASSASARVMGGRMDGSRRAIMLLPEPGGPTMSRSGPPAAAISRARLTVSWPRTSSRSGRTGGTTVPSHGAAGAMGPSPVRWAISWETSVTGKTVSPVAIVASTALAAGT